MFHSNNIFEIRFKLKTRLKNIKISYQRDKKKQLKVENVLKTQGKSNRKKFDKKLKLKNLK